MVNAPFYFCCLQKLQLHSQSLVADPSWATCLSLCVCVCVCVCVYVCVSEWVSEWVWVCVCVCVCVRVYVRMCVRQRDWGGDVSGCVLHLWKWFNNNHKKKGWSQWSLSMEGEKSLWFKITKLTVNVNMNLPCKIGIMTQAQIVPQESINKLE